MTVLQGIVPPIVTPCTPGGGVDAASLDALVDHQLAAGVHGLFALGSSGQVAYLTDAERRQVIERVVTRVAGRVPVVVGVPEMGVRRVIEQARQAVGLGADGVVVTAPLYTMNDTEEIARHFRLVSRAIDAPVIAYDVPVRVRSKLTCELVMRLAAEGSIAGLKDSSGDDVGFRRVVAANRASGSPLAVLTGHEVIVDAMAQLGADGAVPGLANVDPAGYVRLWTACQRGDWQAAQAEQERLARLFEIVFVPQGRSGDAGGIGAFKLAMEILGIIESAAMPDPITSLGEAERAGVEAILRQTGLLA